MADSTTDGPVGIAVWDVSDRQIRAYTHFWPSEATAIGEVEVAVVYDGEPDGDVVLATLEVDYDETLPVTADIPDLTASELMQILFHEQQLEDDRLITIHNEATTKLATAILYDETVRRSYRDMASEFDDIGE